MVNEETPEERLKKYKERIAKMAQAEGRDTKLANPIKSSEPKVKREPEPQPVPQDAPKEPRPKPPPVLVSPSKRELRESQVVKSRRDELTKRIGSKSDRNRVMLRARQKAIVSQLREIKSKKSELERQFKRKAISKDEYERRREILIKEGHELIKMKANIDEALSK